MKQIRQSVFETNSSSSHSISITTGEFNPDSLYVDHEGVCEIHTGEFGWGPERHNDAPTKAAYCLTWVKNAPAYGFDTNKAAKMLQKVVKRVTGAKKVVFVPAFTPETKRQYDYYEWGHIDHQSIEDGGPGEEAFKSEDSLESFIFNHQSTLIIDNDNGM